MPIADAELNKPVNAHLVRPAGDTVYAALQAWRAAPDSYEWWWLLVDHGQARYTALRFEELRDVLAHPDLGVTMDTPLADLPPHRDNPADWESPFPGVYNPLVVENDRTGTAQALRQLRNTPGHVVVVLQGGHLRGILTDSQRTFTFAEKPLLDLLGDYEQPAPPPGGQAPVVPAPDDINPPET